MHALSASVIQIFPANLCWQVCKMAKNNLLIFTDWSVTLWMTSVFLMNMSFDGITMGHLHPRIYWPIKRYRLRITSRSDKLRQRRFIIDNFFQVIEGKFRVIGRGSRLFLHTRFDEARRKGSFEKLAETLLCWKWARKRWFPLNLAAQPEKDTKGKDKNIKTTYSQQQTVLRPLPHTCIEHPFFGIPSSYIPLLSRPSLNKSQEKGERIKMNSYLRKLRWGEIAWQGNYLTLACGFDMWWWFDHPGWKLVVYTYKSFTELFANFENSTTACVCFAEST